MVIGGLMAATTSLCLVAGYVTTSRCGPYAISAPEVLDDNLMDAPLRASGRVRLAASPEKVFDYLSDSQTLPAWMPGLDGLSYDHSASDDSVSIGKGSRRTLMFGTQAELEEIVQFERPTVVAYRILDGVPVRNHLAAIYIDSNGVGGSILTWYQYFDIQRTSLLGWAMPFMVRRFMREGQRNLLQVFGGELVDVGSCL
ncbi:MAG: SRPBCC family protein [Phormidesmis sp.]